ncbi:MAG: hypothetical protein QOF84_2721, partial [Streptomyces sp.]|nr:hypothetical protein [Streptomyces sp.]
MVSYNTDELREFGNMWIDTGNQWNDALNAMKGAMGGLEAAWTGEASNAAMAVWDNKVVTMSTQPQSAGNSVAMTFQQAFTVAWEIGDAINNYADQIDQAVKDINKAELESFLAFLFGAILGFLLPELGALLATLFEVIGEAIGMIVSLIAKILSAMGDLGSIAGFALNSVLGAAVALGEDLFAQQLASWAVGLGQIKIDWGAEGVTLGLGGALGGWLGPDWKGSGGAPHGAPEETPAPKVPVGELPKPGDVPQVGTPVPGHGGGAELTPPPAFSGKGSGISVPEGDIAGLGGGLKVDPPAVKPGTGSHAEPIPQAAAPTPPGPLDGTNPVSSGEGTPVPASGAPARPVPEVGGVNGATSPEGVGAGGGPARPAPGVGEGGSPVSGGVGAGGEARPVTGLGEPHTSAPGGVGEGEAVR